MNPSPAQHPPNENKVLVPGRITVYADLARAAQYGRESYAAVFGFLSFFAGELLPLVRGAGITNSDP